MAKPDGARAREGGRRPAVPAGLGPALDWLAGAHAPEQSSGANGAGSKWFLCRAHQPLAGHLNFVLEARRPDGKVVKVEKVEKAQEARARSLSSLLTLCARATKDRPSAKRI